MDSKEALQLKIKFLKEQLDKLNKLIANIYAESVVCVCCGCLAEGEDEIEKIQEDIFQLEFEIKRLTTYK